MAKHTHFSRRGGSIYSVRDDGTSELVVEDAPAAQRMNGHEPDWKNFQYGDLAKWRKNDPDAYQAWMDSNPVVTLPGPGGRGLRTRITTRPGGALGARIEQAHKDSRRSS